MMPRRRIRNDVWFVLTILIAGCSRSTTLVTASSNNGDGTYTSVRALDQFGNSVQLQHAREAAKRQGRLVISAASSSNNTVVVVSPGSKPMVHSITLPTNNDKIGQRTDFLSICCTGVKGDANWLVLQVRQHMARIWERYNHNIPKSSAVAYFVARLLGAFNGEDFDLEWQSSLRLESDRWARPLGTQTMILSTTNPNILMIEPSGRVMSTKVGNSNLSFAAMGRNSDSVMEHFGRLNVEKLEALDASKLQEILIKLLIEEETNNRDELEIMVEIVTRRGIERQLLRYRNGKLLD